MKTLKPYCASARHAQSDSRKSFGYDLRCKRSSIDKKSFGRTERWKDGRSRESSGTINMLLDRSSQRRIHEVPLQLNNA